MRDIHQRLQKLERVFISHGDKLHILMKVQEIAKHEMASAFLGAQVAGRKQPRQPSPPFAIDRISNDVRHLIHKTQARTNDQVKGG